jgi:hypothetical protein
MGLDYGAFPPPPNKTSLRVRFVPEGVRVYRGGWRIGGLQSVVLVICATIIIRNLFTLLQAAQQRWAQQGVNAANLGAVGRAIIVQVGLPLAVVVAVLIIVALRSALRLGDYWHLVLGSDQWQLRGLFGIRVFGRIAPDDISGIVVARQGQVMAECQGDWQHLSGTLTTTDATWLREALLTFLKQPAAKTSGQLEHQEPGLESSSPRPTVPDWPHAEPDLTGDVFPPSHLAARSGTTLRFELLSPTKPRTGCATCGLVCLGIMLVSGVLGLAMALAIPEARARPLAWVGSVVQIVLVLGVFGYLLRRHRWRAAAPRIEISNHPLYAGSTCEACVCQRGSLSVASICVRLVCAESVSYTDGTVTRSERKEVYDRKIWRNDEFQITEDAPLAERFPISLPAGAMHSFQSAHNWITWKLVVEENVSGRWTTWKGEFPVVVVPPEAPT